MKERKRFEIIRKISEIINKLNPEKNVLLTIVDISLPQKGGKMKIYLSVFPEAKTKEIINYFNRKQKTIKEEIIENVYLRYLPSKIVFYPSFEFKKAQQVLDLINEATKQEKRPKN
jgi:ribosome-binding factor A